MKKKLLLITAAALVCGGNAMAEDQPQIPNGDFETWTYDGENLPNNWNSFRTADGTYAALAGSSQVKRSTDKRPGSPGQYSCSIWARSVFGIVAQGNLTTGRVHAGSMSATDKENYNYSDRDGSNTNKNGITNPCAMKFTGKPKAVKVWVKYVQGGTGYGSHATAKFSAVIHDDGDYISYGLPENDNPTNKALVVASAVKEIEYTDGDWEELNIPFEYTNNGATPAYIQINASTNAYPGAGKKNDYLYIDDIEMVYESAADNVIALINAIGTVAYTDASKQKIDAARSAYNALTDGEKAQVPDNKLTVLTDAEATYAQLKKEAEDYAAAMVVVEKIQAIGTVEYTEASKQKIDEARAAYDALTDAQKVFADKQGLPILTDAEAAYAQLKQQAEKEKQDKATADAAVDKIDAIGTVEYSDASKQKIDDARAAYNALTNDQKALVSAEKLTVLTDAEAAYAQLKQQAEQQAEKEKQDKAAADAAVDKIDAIGTVEYTDASKQKIDDARAAYNALTNDQKALVSADKLTVLTDAETKYAELKQAADEAAAQAAADKDAADAAITSINAIGTVEYTETSKAKIDAARTAYNNLTDAQKALVTKETVAVLTAAEAKYAELEEQAKKEAADKAAAENAITHINAIGTVAYTGESKQKIDAARAAYNNLTDAQKALVSADVVKVLTDTEAAYAELEQAADQAAKDKAAADAAIAKINAIGEVAYTDASKAKIDAARTAYAALTDAQKALVSASDLAKLTSAEAKYAELKQAAEEAAAQAAKDKAAADAAIAKINAIGTVEYTDASKAKIDAARTAYDALTDAQKALVSADIVKVLTDAEAAYAELEQAADQAAKDKTAADAAIAKINAIGTVEYNDASKQKIDAAREAYDALTADQKALVTASDLAKLTSAETKYAELKKQAEEAAQQAEQAAKELAEAKTALSEGISEAKKYYESIKADYAGVAATLQAAINAAAEVLNSATVTKAQADDAKAALAAAVKKAQTDVTVITGIKTVKTTKAASANDVWYDMIGNRLPGKPQKKGIYIKNGRKVVIR